VLPSATPQTNSSSQVKVARVGARAIYPDFIGFNEDVLLVNQGDPWSDVALREAFASLRPDTFRYAGGSQGNYRNWREGKCDTAIDYASILVP
jgi:hypothetical protein